MYNNMDKDDNLVFRHLLDLAKAAYTRDTTVFSDFLNVREAAVLKRQEAYLQI